MCHPEVPPGTPWPDVRVEEASITVASGERMPALVAFPERTPAPGVLIINDVFGRSPFYDHLAGRLAQAGFVATTPEYFFRQGPLPEPTREAAMARAKQLDFRRWGEDMSAAVDWVRGHRDVNGAVGTIGFCMGGTQALLLAARRQDLAATVSYYGFPADARTAASPIEVAAKCTARSSANGAIRTRAWEWRTSRSSARRCWRRASSTSSTSIRGSRTAS